MKHPEWAAYLAAFDAYIDALARDDKELEDQAKLVMGWFADDLLGIVPRRRTAARATADLFSLLGLDSRPKTEGGLTD